MSAPVWVLSVDLQAKTATFQSGLADAARSARSSFQDIGSSARSGMRQIEEGTVDVRHSLGLMDNAIRGNHAAAMVDMIRLFQSSSIVMAAIPFAATIGGVLLLAGGVIELVKHLQEMKEAEEKLANDQTRLGTTVNEVFNGLDTKIIEAQKQADELANNHLAALHAQLQLIDRQSMSELVHSFDTVAKAADTVFGELKTSWYQFGIGSAGASHALDQFKTQYESLIAQGKEGEAGDLLKGTAASAQRILDAQNAARSATSGGTGLLGRNVDYSKEYAARLELQKAGVGYSDKEVQAQQALVSALNAQLGVEERVSELKKLESQNATTQTGNEAASRRAEAARQSAEVMARMGAESIAADHATADAQLTIHRASLEERLASDLDFAARDRDLASAANQAQIAALDRSGKDYENQLKNLQDKQLEITAQYDAKVAELKAKSLVATYERDLQDLQQTEQEKIEATRQGSAARLQAIDAAIAQEEAKNLQETDFYRSLLKERVEVIRQMSEEENRQRAEAGREAAQNDIAMGNLQVAALKQYFALRDSTLHANMQREIEEQTTLANVEYQLKLNAMQREAAALDKSAADYENKLKTIQDKEKALVQQHEQQITQIQQQAEEQRNKASLDALTRLEEMTATGLTSVLMGHESFTKMMLTLGDQVVSGMIQNALMSIMAADMTKEREAAAAARKMFLAGASLPFPANIVAAPVMAAGAFAAVMAFNEGGLVPGVGRGDIVPAMLTPGEAVLPKNMTEMLNNAARSGTSGTTHVTHVHVRPTYHVQAIDGSGMAAALEKHNDVLVKHVHNVMRRANR